MTGRGPRIGWATALAAIALLSFGTAEGTAAEGPPTELWKEYPLDPTPERRSLAGDIAPASPSPDGGSGLPHEVLLAIFVLVAATLLARKAGAGLRIAVPRPTLRRLSGPRAPPPRHLEFPKLGQDRPLALPPPVETLVPLESETCLIDWWRGYWKSDFYATATRPDGRRFIAARSPMFKWRADEEPAAAGAALHAHKQLVERLLADRWQADEGRGKAWYAQTFRRRYADSGEPESEDRDR